MEYQFFKAHHGVWMKGKIQSLSFRILGGILGLLLLAIFSSGCSNEKSGKPVSAPIPVTVSTAIQKMVPVQLLVIGNVQAYSTVAVKSLVGGELVGVHFTEGQDVKKGDLLFRIDSQPFEAALKQAEANLQKDLAQAKNAQEDARRYEFLIQKSVVARQQYDKVRTDADALEATVLADRAAVNNAEIQLGYCSIHSPIDGRTGSINIKKGNIIAAVGQPNAIDLVTINQIIPIYVIFYVPEQNLPEIKKYMARGSLKVEALPPNDTSGGEQGILTFIDNTVDKTTGTILLKGTFANREKKLWPGQFVNVVLTLTTEPNAIVVPSQAIQTGQEGQYVFVIKPDLTADNRPVVISRTIDKETIIEKGLQAGERVVTDGQLQLVPGTKVEVKASPGGPGKGS
ncbi:MAG: efflux RND transporter periplasmic adaptor subunit [Thermodesulfobacteriota bacterium]|jgi:multidrug efflux system membrane fusion protein